MDKKSIFFSRQGNFQGGEDNDFQGLHQKCFTQNVPHPTLKLLYAPDGHISDVFQTVCLWLLKNTEQAIFSDIRSFDNICQKLNFFCLFQTSLEPELYIDSEPRLYMGKKEILKLPFTNDLNYINDVEERYFINCSVLKTLECNILNPDGLINLEINYKRRTSIIQSRD